MNNLSLGFFDEVFEFLQRSLEDIFLKIRVGDKNGFVTDHDGSFRLKPAKTGKEMITGEIPGMFGLPP